MITTVSTAFERELLKFISERKAVGKIAAFNEVISMCDEVSATINKTM